jgi:PAS domain-containing protein
MDTLAYLLQNVHFEGPLGLIVAIAILLGILWAGWKAGLGLWRAIAKPIRDRLARVRVAEFEREFIGFLGEWFDHQRDIAVFVLDGDFRCIYANQGVERMFCINFEDDLKGRKWQQLARDPDAIITKWESAKRNQRTFSHIGTQMKDGIEQTYLTKAEPFVFKGRVLYYFARVQAQQETNIRMLDQAREQ